MALSRNSLSWMKVPAPLAIVASQTEDGSPSLPHAVILRSQDSLHCFERTSDLIYEIMTIQRGFEEEPMCFEAGEETLYQRCIPTILSKIFTSEQVHLALIDMDLEWDHETLLQGWLDYQKEAQRAVQNVRVTLRTFIAEEAYDPIPYTETTWPGLDTKFMRRERVSGVSITASLSNSNQLGVTVHAEKEGISFLITAVDDIPADFDRIVWMLMYAGTRHIHGLDHRLIEMLRREGCVTTLSAANHLYPLPALNNVLSIYRKLRYVQGKTVFVPMVGFEADWLRASSYLQLFSNITEINIKWKEFERLRFLRYYTSQLLVSGKDPLLLSAQRCLSMADQGLLLFDLTEDIIYDLTGQSQFRISFADVCRVYQTLQQHTIG